MALSALAKYVALSTSSIKGVGYNAAKPSLEPLPDTADSSSLLLIEADCPVSLSVTNSHSLG